MEKKKKVKMDQNPSSSRADREKNRRNQMKSLCSKLYSLVPHQTSREGMSLPDQLDEATDYIKKLQEDLQRMKMKKERLIGRANSPNARLSDGDSVERLTLPMIDVREMGSAMEVVLVTGFDYKFMFNEVIRILHEEGVDVLNASFSVLGDVVFHTIHAKVEESNPECGGSGVSERMRNFVQYGSS